MKTPLKKNNHIYWQAPLAPVLDRGQDTCNFVVLFFLVPQHVVESPAVRAVLLMMFKEYILATAEFLIIGQVSMAKNAAIFPGESELPTFRCLPSVCSTDHFFFTTTRMGFTGPCEPSLRLGCLSTRGRPGWSTAPHQRGHSAAAGRSSPAG